MLLGNIRKVSDYLSEAGTFFVATIDENKPKCRPFGFHMLHEGRIYFGLGTYKDVYKQISSNPNIEVCAMKDSGFLRYYGYAVFEKDQVLTQKALNFMPHIKRIYEENGFKLALIYLRDATAEFRTAEGLKESIKFQ